MYKKGVEKLINDVTADIGRELSELERVWLERGYVRGQLDYVNLREKILNDIHTINHEF